LRATCKELQGESDRACALIAGAAISDALGNLLRRYFVKLKETDINRLFHDLGAPLGGFASRTDVAFALGLISPQERVDANVIRKIRNQFAHTLAQIDFSQELIASEMIKVLVKESLWEATPKRVFIDVSMTLYMAIIERTTYIMKKVWNTLN
jgi:DNA-binding MltR family transcriptional regulator